MMANRSWRDSVGRRRTPGLPSLKRPRPPRWTGTGEPALVIAHRGASLDFAEHTLAAYQGALDTGADGFECDVRMTRDGHLVCIHDRRVDRTTNGRGVVSTMTLDELRRLDFMARPDAAATETGVLTLTSLLSLAIDAGRPLRLLIETKHPNRYAGKVELDLVRLLQRYGLAHRPGQPFAPPNGVGVTVMSFASTSLRRIRLLSPSLPTVLLLNRLLPPWRNGELPTGTRIAGPGVDLVRADPGFVARAHGHGNQVYVWTVDDPIDQRMALQLGVDALITNDPAGALRSRAAPV